MHLNDSSFDYFGYKQVVMTAADYWLASIRLPNSSESFPDVYYRMIDNEIAIYITSFTNLVYKITLVGRRKALIEFGNKLIISNELQRYMIYKAIEHIKQKEAMNNG